MATSDQYTACKSCRFRGTEHTALLSNPPQFSPCSGCLDGDNFSHPLKLHAPGLGIPVVGLSGPAGCGKSHAAQVLIDGLGYVKLPLAGPLKAMLRALPGITHDHTDGALKETPLDWMFDQTPRRLMQTLGTEWGRGIDSEFWLQMWLRSAGHVLNADSVHTPPGIVVDDVRFENEARFLQHRAGASVIFLDATAATTLTGTDQQHSSEREFDRVRDIADHVVTNRKDGHERFASAILSAVLR